MMERAHDPEQQIAERYFLGELTDAEAEAFEAHYFDCARCAEYVVETQMLLDGGREVARERKAAPPAPVVQLGRTRNRWRRWMPAAVAASLVIAVAAPLLMRGAPEVQELQLISTRWTVEFAQSRDEAAPEPLFPPDVPFVLDVRVPPVPAGPVVELSVREATKKKVRYGPARAAESQLRAPILVQLVLPAGDYEIVVESVQGKRREELHARRFKVAVQQ